MSLESIFKLLTVKKYMIPVYAVLVKAGRDIETLPEAYILPVAEYLAEQEEATQGATV